MITYIISGHPQKKLWEILRTDNVFERVRHTNNSFVFITDSENDIQIILLPDLGRNGGDNNKKRVIQLINQLNLPERKNLYLILHRNDFSGNERINSVTTDEPCNSPLIEYNGKIRYYTSERMLDNLYKYLIEKKANADYLKNISIFF